VPGTTPTIGATRFTAAVNDDDGSSVIASATIRIECSHNSFGYFFGAGMTSA
jgi:hypothetical protein